MVSVPDKPQLLGRLFPHLLGQLFPQLLGRPFPQLLGQLFPPPLGLLLRPAVTTRHLTRDLRPDRRTTITRSATAAAHPAPPPAHICRASVQEQAARNDAGSL